MGIGVPVRLKPIRRLKKRDQGTAAPSVAAAKSKGCGIFEKELTFFRKEQAETREVHLLLVGLDLRKVGVVGGVQRE